ncbi:MAG: chemotaxis protein CheB [Tunicatimonas sp.]
MKNLRIIVIGASMGGIEYFTRLIPQLSADWPIAVFIVQHIASGHTGQLDRILSECTSLTVKKAEDGEAIRPGHVYVAPSDQHLIVGEKVVKTSYGPMENGSRPSINTLFRSAAVAHQHRTIGILFTGLLSDGTRGLKAIQECGGTTIVQDPDEAPYPDMPTNAINNGAADYISEVGEMGALIKILLKKVPVTSGEPPLNLRKQVEIATAPVKQASNRQENNLNHQAPTTEDASMEGSLWSVLQFMQERTNMLENLVAGEEIKGRPRMADNFRRKAEESHIHTENMRLHLVTLTGSIANPDE